MECARVHGKQRRGQDVRLIGAALGLVLVLGGAVKAAAVRGEGGTEPGMEWVERALGWYGGTAPLERVGWGGLAACVLLAGHALVGRMAVLRGGRVIPRVFRERMLRRLEAGELDGSKALDFCELNPSPAARVALAALRRWGHTISDVERALSLACRVEVASLRRQVSTLQRIGWLAPMIGLLGTLGALGACSLGGDGLLSDALPLGHCLTELTAGVGLSILVLIAHDGVSGRVEQLTEELEGIGLQLLDIMVESGQATRGRPRLQTQGEAAVRGPHRLAETQRSVEPPASA